MSLSIATLAVPAVLFLATLIRSTFGFGEALFAVPLLALLMPVEVAAPVAALVSITVAGIVMIEDWRKVHAGSAGRLVLSTVLGIPLGLVLLKTASEGLVKAILGVVIIAFASVNDSPPAYADDTSTKWGHAMGEDNLAKAFAFVTNRRPKIT